MRPFLPVISALLLASCGYAWSEDSPPLIRLPKQATSPDVGYKKGAFGPTGHERSLAGWLVLNGARFRNADFPELAQTLIESYRQQGYVLRGKEFTPLPAEPIEKDSHGEAVKGLAICPSSALCGLVGDVMPFNLDASL
jgi:hypothetical protein